MERFSGYGGNEFRVRRKVIQGEVESFSCLGGKIFVAKGKLFQSIKNEKRKDFQG